jgi:hypothetical protein
MLRKYGYIGLLLMLFVEINFFAKIQPFATFYIPIVWFGYMFFVDSLVYKIKKKSFITSHPKEFLFSIALSLPFWLIFEIYNVFTGSWFYINYPWYVHVVDFTTIMPAILITFSLMNALEIGKRFDKKARPFTKHITGHTGAIMFLLVIGVIAMLVPILVPTIGFSFMWVGIILLFDPLNYLIGRPSVIKNIAAGKKSIMVRLFLSGITMGFFWEFWNYQAVPKWIYNIPIPFQNVKLFAMPILGYLGYMPFAIEVFLFYALFRSFLFKKGNETLSISAA